MAALSEVAPEAITAAAAVEAAKTPAAAGQSQTNGTTTTYPSNAGGAVEVVNNAGLLIDSYSIGLPTGAGSVQAEVSDEAVTYNNGDGSSTVATTRNDGAVAVHTIIEEASAPERYAYPISSPDGANLTLLEDGSVDVIANNGDFITHIYTPWARDALGADVPTRYVVEGSTLVQEVQHAGSQYPVVADPTSSRYYTQVVVDRSANPLGPIVRVYPNLAAMGSHANGDSLYEDYKTLVSTAFEGRKYRDQLVCHYANIPGKSPWNLDSWRPDVGYTKTVLAACNP